jgi:hypothetical protein
VRTSSVSSPARSQLAEDAEDAAGAVHVFHVDVLLAGATLHSTGTLRLSRSMSSMVKSTSPSWAMASRCSTVLVEPPMAMSRLMAFSNASKVAMPRAAGGFVVLLIIALGQIDDQVPGLEEQRLAVGMGGERRAVARQRQAQGLGRQFMELAVNMPEQEPQVGQAFCSISATSASVTVVGGGDHRIDQVETARRRRFRIDLARFHRPAGDEDAGMLSRMAAISMPGVILSQLEMQTIASAQWALTMYSTLSAMTSREGSE